MTEQEMRTAVASRTALLNELNRVGLRPLEGSEDQIIRWFTDKGVTADTSAGFLQLRQADGSEVIPSKACLTLRQERPELFASSVKFDKVSSLEDFNRGTLTERTHARAEFIREHGLSAFEKLPRTKAEAERRSCEIGPGMTRSEYLSLSLSEKSRLAGVIGSAAIAVIMSRR